jgi:hypothetical protein
MIGEKGAASKKSSRHTKRSAPAQEENMRRVGNKNALKHGVFTEIVMLPDEDPKEFEELHRSLIDEWDPCGPTEEDIVLGLAQQLWRKRRIVRFQNRKIEATVKRNEALDLLLEKHDKTYSMLLNDIQAGNSLTEQIILEKFGPSMAQYFKTKVPRDKFKSDSEWIKAVNELANDVMEVNTVIHSHSTWTEDELSDEAIVTKELALEERIDAGIDSSIKRLGHVMAFKSMVRSRSSPMKAEPLKEIEAPKLAIEADE